MTKRATIRQADVSRIVRGAIKAGLPVGSFTVEVVDKTIHPDAPGNFIFGETQWLRTAT